MIDFLYQADLSVFYAINHGLSSKGLDKFFVLITTVDNWLITYVLCLYLLIFKGGKKGKIAAALVLVMIAVTDQTGAKLLKEWFARPRPCTALPDALTPNGKLGSYSFPSNHALNNFAVAMFFGTLYRQYAVALFIIAALVALSRVYLGLHYPSDIAGGALLGTGFGYLFSLLHEKLQQRFA